MTEYGGNYHEWGIACPDGEVWAGTVSSESAGRSALATADKDCGCEQSPHILVFRDVPEWVAVNE